MDNIGMDLTRVGLTRREALAGIGGTMLVAAAPPVFAASAIAPPQPLRAAAREAYLYTLPLIESAASRAGAARSSAINDLARVRNLMSPATQRVTTPNNDTLNARGWIDLATGPVKLHLPATGERYISVALLDFYSNNFAVLGSRTTGPDGGVFTVIGPDHPALPGAIRSPTRWALVIFRVLTMGGADIDAARAIQDRCRLDAARWEGSLPAYAARDAGGAAYFAAATRLLQENPPPVTDQALLRRAAAAGLLPFDEARFGPAEVAQIEGGMDDARRHLASGGESGLSVNGWAYPRPTFGNFRQDYAYRAQIALSGYGGLPVEEAVYLYGSGNNGSMRYDSKQSWRLRLASDSLPPVDGFWSLTIYRATADGQFFLFENPRGSNAIGDRTADLRRVDGAIEIDISREPPARADGANWLPAPRDAPFGLLFRAYRPRAPILDGRWRLPPLELLE